MINDNYWVVINDLKSNPTDYSHGIRTLALHANRQIPNCLIGTVCDSSYVRIINGEKFGAEITSDKVVDLLNTAKKE